MEIKGKAEKLFKKVKTFIISCIDEEGFPMCKAVVPPKHRHSLEEFYFSTNTSSKFARCIKKNQYAGVYFYSRGITWKGCYLKGKMEIISDIEIKKEYWRPAFKNAYPEKSYLDPDFCLIKFIPTSGRFYSWYKPEDFDI